MPASLATTAPTQFLDAGGTRFGGSAGRPAWHSQEAAASRPARQAQRRKLRVTIGR
jgi:hypothetical protein